MHAASLRHTALKYVFPNARHANMALSCSHSICKSSNSLAKGQLQTHSCPTTRRFSMGTAETCNLANFAAELLLLKRWTGAIAYLHAGIVPTA